MNTMKFLVLLFSITICFGWVSCKDKEELNPLAGLWRATDESYHVIKDDTIIAVHAELKGDSLYEYRLNDHGEKKLYKEYITFNSDGTYKSECIKIKADSVSIEHGIYRLEGNKLRFQSENEDVATDYVVLELTAGRLVLYIYDKHPGECKSDIDCDKSIYEVCDKILYQRI
jgi:hypothetical protein